MRYSEQLQVNSNIEAFDYILDESWFSEMSSIVRSESSLAAAVANQFPHVAPIEMTLGSDLVSRKKHFMHYVPLIPCLKNFLFNQYVMSAILLYNHERANNKSDSQICDVVLQESCSPDFSVVDIPLIFYLDEFEPCIPIGSKRKIHKLTVI